MDNNNYEQEIDLKDLLIAVMRRWRLIIITGVLLAVCFGGYKVGKAVLNGTDQEALEKAKAEYEDEVLVYNSSKESAEREIDNIIENIKAQDDYMEKSILMKISPYNKALSFAEIYVDTDYQIMPDLAYQNMDYTKSIIKAYVRAIQNGQLVDAIAEKMGVERRFLQELIGLDADFGTDVISLSVTYMDEETSKEIMNMLLDAIVSYSDTISESMGNHKISIVSEQTSSEVDMNLATFQKENGAKSSELKVALKDKKKELSELKEPVMASFSKKAVIKSGIKYAVLGGVMGGFIIVFCVCVGYLMSDKVASEREVRGRFGIRILGIFNGVRKRRFLGCVDEWLDKLDGITRGTPEEATYEVIAANIKNHSNGLADLLITGTIEYDQLEKVAEGLKSHLSDVNMRVGANMGMNASTLQELPKCGKVLLVEKRGVSTYGGIQQEVDTVKDIGKEIVGCVLL